MGSGVPSNSPAVSAAAAAGASKKKVRDAVPPSLEQQWLRSQRTQRSHTIEELTREVEADRLKVTQMHSSRNLSDALASGVIRHSKFKEFYRDCCVFSTDGMSREELAFAIVLMGVFLNTSYRFCDIVICSGHDWLEFSCGKGLVKSPKNCETLTCNMFAVTLQVSLQSPQ